MVRTLLCIALACCAWTEAALGDPDAAWRGFRGPVDAGVAAEQLRATWLLPSLARELDSERLIHRQFAQDTIETLLDCDLEAETGYRFWMTPDERAPVLRRVRGLIDERPAAPVDTVE